MPVLLYSQLTPHSGSLTGNLKDALHAVSAPPLFTRKKIVDVKSLTVEGSYNYLHDTSGLALGSFKQLQGSWTYGTALTLSVAEIPFDLAFRANNGIYTNNTPSLNDLSQFNFNKEKYLESIRAQVKDKLDPATLANVANNRITAIRRKYEQELKAELNKLEAGLGRGTAGKLGLPEGVANLSATDESSLQTALFSPKLREQYKESNAALQQMLLSKDAVALQSDTMFKKHSATVEHYQALEKAYSTIVNYRHRFRDNKLVKELQESLPEGGDYQAYLQQPGNLVKTAKQNFSLTGLQRFFTNVTHLDLGQNALSGNGSAFSPANLVNTGLNAGYQTDKASFGFVHGKNNNNNSWLQNGLTSAVTNEYNSMTGFTVGTGSASPVDQTIAVNLYNVRSSNNNNGLGNQMLSNYLPSPSHSTAVVSLHTGLQLKGTHKLELDLSKSFGSFREGAYYDSSNGKSSSTGSILDGGSSNYAAKINYEGDLFETGITAYVGKVGLAYNNPGNYLLRRGESQMGLALNRQFLNRKLTAKYQFDYRLQQFDPGKAYSYTSISNKWQTAYKFRRNNKLGLTYLQTSYRSVLQNASASAGGNTRWQLDGAYQVKRWRKTIMNNTSFSWQRLKMPLLDGGSFNNSSLLLTHTSSIQLKQNLLSVSVVSNNSNNKDYYFNTSLFSTECSYAYTVRKYLRLSSGVGYYANAGWNKQLGYTQQCSVTLSEKWDIDLQGGYKKAIQQQRAELANQLYLNSNIRYHF
ncbi:hypothetical protein [Filimonas effusa]|uniref:Uncharacterized protein n=1 Tax=Filimonas effusa TaxID=2508721 RepID=A0A4Q1D9R2_9BACT|nr:hypothetical protein [Filimonas effusa]RXK85263.1 hypothetical protein ESB13_00080 [Filimonas effusa]